MNVVFADTFYWIAFTSRGYVKEYLFHNVSVEFVRTTVECTIQAIRAIWFAVHGRIGPKWLKNLDSTGHFERLNLELVPRKIDPDPL